MCPPKAPSPPPAPAIDATKAAQDAEASKAAETERVRRVNKGGIRGLLYSGTGFTGVGGNTLGQSSTLGQSA